MSEPKDKGWLAEILRDAAQQMDSLPDWIRTDKGTSMDSERLREHLREWVAVNWRLREENEALKSALASSEAARKEACPCTYGRPCSQQCSCAHPVRSGGCDMCCSYGSEEQRQASAEHLMTREEARKEDRELIAELAYALESASRFIAKKVGTLNEYRIDLIARARASQDKP